MKVHILDDWFDTLRGLPCFQKLAAHDVTVWTDHEPDPVKLAERIQEAEGLVLFRERTKIGPALLDNLPNLKLISQRSVYPHVDVEACTANDVLLCSNMHSDTPSYAAAEMTLAWPHVGALWLWAHRTGRGRICRSNWDDRAMVGVRRWPRAGLDGRQNCRRIPRGVLCDKRRHQPACAAETRNAGDYHRRRSCGNGTAEPVGEHLSFRLNCPGCP